MDDIWKHSQFIRTFVLVVHNCLILNGHTHTHSKMHINLMELCQKLYSLGQIRGKSLYYTCTCSTPLAYIFKHLCKYLVEDFSMFRCEPYMYFKLISGNEIFSVIFYYNV